MTENSQPSRNPANSSGDIPSAMREIFAKFLQSSIDDMLPAKIIAYDRTKNRATIKPLIAMITTNGNNISRNQLASIPVLNVGGGDCILSFNLSPGDLGWIKANDRDIADFLKGYSESVPGTKRIHDFNNGLFIPDVMTGYTINGEDSENAVFQTIDGTVRVSLFPNKIKMTAPLIEINGPLEARSTLLVDGASEFKSTVKVNGASEFKSTVTVDGHLEAKTTLAAIGLLTASGGLALAGGITSSSGPIEMTGNVELLGNLYLDGDLETTGQTDLGGLSGAAIARIGDTTSGGFTINSGSSNSRSV